MTLGEEVYMPIVITDRSTIKPGEIYEDPFYHPCLCVRVENKEVTGISLVDGSYPRAADLGASAVRKLTVEEAWEWRRRGPIDMNVPAEVRWWK